MFITTSVYFLLLFLIFWSYCGYLILLIAFSTLSPRTKRKITPPEKPSKIAVFIPCFNEEDYAAGKIDNLKEMKYGGGEFEVYFLHGASDDKTSAEISARIADRPDFHLLETGCRGKINQLNYGLSRVGGEADIIVSTDMDAALDPDILSKIVAEFDSDPRVAVVGANISPHDSISLEKDYWRDQNLLRLVESEVYTSSIVVAPCYAFRTSLLTTFPEDCIADDIYTAFKANTEGFLTRYIESGKGVEIRSPSTTEEFLRHKFRKGNAYLVELFRYFYRLPEMSGWWKVIYLTKLLQLAVIPWILPYFLLSTISLCLSGWGLFQIALFGILFLTIFLILTSLIMDRFRLKYLESSGSKLRPTFALFALSNIILILVGLSFPFYKQTSSYRKIRDKAD